MSSASSPTPNADTPPSLPVELVTAILQHASQQDSQTAARVCSGWKAASLAATRQVVVRPRCNYSKLASLVDWLSVNEQHLDNLTSLRLNFGHQRLHGVQHLPCKHLRELALCSIPPDHVRTQTALRPAALQSCAGSLTRLVVTGFDLSKQTANSLGQLTALQNLELDDCVGLSAAALLGLPSLRSLQITQTEFSSAAQLPSFLAQQQQLTRLHLQVNNDDFPPDSGDDPTWECQLAASLTGSSLQHLDLRCLCLSQSAWQHMIPAGRTLPQLRYVGLPQLWDDDGDYKLNSDDVHALARCCPALQALECYTYDEPLSFQPALRSLPHLTSLHAAVPDDVTAVQVVTVLTALQRLRIQYLPSSMVAGSVALLPVLQCTRLTSLTLASYHQNPAHDSVITTLAKLGSLVELDMSHVKTTEAQLLSLMPLALLSRLVFSTGGLSSAFGPRACSTFHSPPDIPSSLEVKMSPGGPPDVWQQLFKCFVPVYEQQQQDVAGLRQQVAQQQRDIQQLQHQHAFALSDRDATVAELQQEVARLQRRLQLLQQPLGFDSANPQGELLQPGYSLSELHYQQQEHQHDQ